MAPPPPPARLLHLVHAPTVVDVDDDCDEMGGPEQHFAGPEQTPRQVVNRAIARALRGCGATSGQVARPWQEAPRVVLKRWAGDKPITAEHLAALPGDRRAAALAALAALPVLPLKRAA